LGEGGATSATVVTLLTSAMEPPSRPVTKASFKAFNVCSSMVKEGEVTVASRNEFDLVSRRIDKLFSRALEISQIRVVSSPRRVFDLYMVHVDVEFESILLVFLISN
jgi:hypothetical protein